MGWIDNLFQKIGGAAPKDLVFASEIPVPGKPSTPLVADECYVELVVESLRLTKARTFATTFQGVVYTYVGMVRQGEENAKYAAVSKPDKLMALDKNSLNKVITVSRQMMGLVPWRGGRMNLELGLFSVKSGNVLTPVVDYVTKVSSAAGLSFVGAIKPFVPLLTEGMDLIAGQTQDTAIVVGLDTSLDLNSTGYFAIVDASKVALDVAKLSVDPADCKLLLNGQPLEAGYCVFSIQSSTTKPDFGEIPELKEKYAAIQAAIRANKLDDARAALTAFRLATIASPDLISADARTLVQRAELKVKEAFPAGGTGKSNIGSTALLPALADIGLYDGAPAALVREREN